MGSVNDDDVEEIGESDPFAMDTFSNDEDGGHILFD